MKYYIGVTDNDWFHFLARRRPDEVNFWRPRNMKTEESTTPIMASSCLTFLKALWIGPHRIF